MRFTKRRMYRILMGLSILLAGCVIMFGRGYALEAPSVYPDNRIIQGSGSEVVAAPTMDVYLDADFTLSWRGTLLGADHGPGLIHHDSAYVQIDDGPIIYYTSIPARKEGNLLADTGILWHNFSRDRKTAYIQAHHQRRGRRHFRNRHCRGAPSECRRGFDGTMGGSELSGTLNSISDFGIRKAEGTACGARHNVHDARRKMQGRRVRSRNNLLLDQPWESEGLFPGIPE